MKTQVLHDFITQIQAIQATNKTNPTISQKQATSQNPQPTNPLQAKITAVQDFLSTHFVLDSKDKEAFLTLKRSLNAPLKIAVIGQFSSGKSSFLNALLGQNILPSGIIPVTAKVCEICYGESAFLQINYKDGTQELTNVDFLATQSKKIAQIDSFKLYAPNEILRHITFLDTPGFNSQNAQDTDISNNILQAVDGIIWLSLIDNVGKNSEKEVLNNHIKKFKSKSLCVLNQKDRLKNDNEINTSLQYAKTAFSGIFEDIVAISAKDALQAKLEADSTRLESSNINAVLCFINDHLLAQKDTSKTNKAHHTLRALIIKHYKRTHSCNKRLYALQDTLKHYALHLTKDNTLNDECQSLFNALDSRFNDLTQYIFSSLKRESITLSRKQKSSLGFSKMQNYDKQTSILPLDSLLSAIAREDSEHILAINKLASEIKNFGKEFLESLKPPKELLEDFKSKSLQIYALPNQSTNDLATDSLPQTFENLLLTLPKNMQRFFLTRTFILHSYENALQEICAQFFLQTHSLSQLLQKSTPNALKLVCLELDCKIKRAIEAHKTNPDKFALYEPTMENIRDLLNNALYFELFLERLFLHNNLAKVLTRSINEKIQTLTHSLSEQIQNVIEQNTTLLVTLKKLKQAESKNI